VRAQLTESLARADEALGFSEVGEEQYVTPTGDGFVELDEEVKEQRISAQDELLSSAVKEQQLAEQLGEKSRFEELLDADPLTAHIQSMMSELTGTPLNLPVPRDFLAAVELKVQQKFNSDTKGGRYSARDSYCRLQGIRRELRSILSGNSSQLMTAPGAAEVQQTRKVFDSLVYVAWVESQYKPTVCSSAGARGMWQFIPSTARRYDMVVDQQVDERCQWRKATASAAGYFSFLLGHFDGYPFLALAAYNAGENAIDRRVIRDPDIPKHLRNFYGFTAAGVLHPETMKYVPSIVASAFIGSAAENSGKGDPADPMADYTEARRLWTNKYPNSRRVKLWDRCTSVERAAPVNLNCRAAGARSPCKGIP
ncbi:MAG: lytic transglycosylase domain-containing protein, partial [Myxococcota bacterium]|nr:lytic transglycosylase domain-containing protein [Myxococcota bacterium]